MWQAAEATIALGSKFLPSAERCALGLSNLVEVGSKLPALIKGKLAGGLPDVTITGAEGKAIGLGTEAKAAEIAAEAKAAAQAAKPVDVHVSASQNLKLHDVDPGTAWKPKGLWTSDKLAWVPQSRPISPLDVVRGHAYHVDTSGARMFNVGSVDDLQGLIRRYGNPSPYPSKFDGKISLPDIDLAKIGRASEPELRAFRNSDINWREMAKDFDGIRFSNYQGIKQNAPVPHWFDGLDLNSAVTWNNVGKVQITPLGKVPSYYEPAFQENLKALITKAAEVRI